MTHPELLIADTAEAVARPEVTAGLTRGIARLLADQGCAVLAEMRLANGRRADLVGLCPKGMITLVEIKSCRADFETDSKWGDYLDYCDAFYFGVSEAFPQTLLPEDEGLIVADAFGGAVLRGAQPRKLAAARRKAVMLRFARQAAFTATRPLVAPSDPR